MAGQQITRASRAIPVFVVNPVSAKDMGEPDVQAVGIALGANITGAIALTGNLQRIVVPANWTAADLTFQSSYDGGTTWFNMYDSFGGEYTVKAGASRVIVLPPADFLGIRDLKIRSGTNAAAVNQAAAVSLQLVQLP